MFSDLDKLLNEVDKLNHENLNDVSVHRPIISLIVRGAGMLTPEIVKYSINNRLEKTVLTVTFTKKDGTERVMKCTLKSDLLPPQVVNEDKPAKKKSNTSVAVFDVEANAWRSFSYDSVISFSWENEQTETKFNRNLALRLEDEKVRAYWQDRRDTGKHAHSEAEEQMTLEEYSEYLDKNSNSKEYFLALRSKRLDEQSSPE